MSDDQQEQPQTNTARGIEASFDPDELNRAGVDVTVGPVTWPTPPRPVTPPVIPLKPRRKQRR